MLHVYEFEVFEEDGGYIALPFDFEGGTQGSTLRETCEMAAAWLQTEIEFRSMHGETLPDPTFGNKPKYNGERTLVAVHAGKDTVPRITAAEAARRLGVTRGRVSQMITSGLLDTFELDGRTWVSEYSVNARLEEKPSAGRPRKTAMS